MGRFGQRLIQAMDLVGVSRTSASRGRDSLAFSVSSGAVAHTAPAASMRGGTRRAEAGLGAHELSIEEGAFGLGARAVIELRENIEAEEG